MAINEREHHIKVLENLLSHYKAREKCEGYYDSTLKDNVEALECAISSIKTDLFYDLCEENIEFYTKEEVIAILEDLLKDIEGMDSREGECIYATPWCINRDIVIDIIQERIKEWEKLSSEKQ